jgi:S1-C subfamily serine protease
MKKVKLLLLLAFCAGASHAQNGVWKESVNRDRYEIVRETNFAGVDVQEDGGRPVVRKVMSEGKYPNDFLVGDVITGIEDITVAKTKEWEAAMDRFKPEQKVTVHVLRAGKATDVVVRLRKVPVFGKVV